MKRQMYLVVMFALCAVVALAAQAPAGWKLRVDESASASDPDQPGPIKFTKTATGFQAINPQAAIYWHPSNVASGSYSLKGTFTLLKPSGHTNYYGLVFGGSDLEGPRQTYLYFVVAQDGTWLIKHRGGKDTQEVTEKTGSVAVKKPGANGMSVNALEVRVLADKIEYFVNGTMVHTTPKSGMTAKTDGLYGIRINHLLEVRIDGFGMSRL